MARSAGRKSKAEVPEGLTPEQLLTAYLKKVAHDPNTNLTNYEGFRLLRGNRTEQVNRLLEWYQTGKLPGGGDAQGIGESKKMGVALRGENVLARGSLEEDRLRLQQEEEQRQARGAIDDLIAGATAAQPVHALLISSDGEAATFRITSPDDPKGSVSPAEFCRLFASLSQVQVEGIRPKIDVFIASARFEIRLRDPDTPETWSVIVLARTAEEAAFLDRAYNEVFDETNEPVDINDMDAAAKIQVAAEILSSVYPAEHVGKALEYLAAQAARETTGRATAAPRPEAASDLTTIRRIAALETLKRDSDLLNPSLAEDERLRRARRLTSTYERIRERNPDFHDDSPQIQAAWSIINKRKSERKLAKLAANLG